MPRLFIEKITMILTRREKHFLVIAALIAISSIVIPDHFTDDLEMILIYFFAFPIGLYVATDPERKNEDG